MPSAWFRRGLVVNTIAILLLAACSGGREKHANVEPINPNPDIVLAQPHPEPTPDATLEALRDNEKWNNTIGWGLVVSELVEEIRANGKKELSFHSEHTNKTYRVVLEIDHEYNHNTNIYDHEIVVVYVGEGRAKVAIVFFHLYDHGEDWFRAVTQFDEGRIRFKDGSNSDEKRTLEITIPMERPN